MFSQLYPAWLELSRRAHKRQYSQNFVTVCFKYLQNTISSFINPTLVIEVLSPSTEVYDRGEKFRHYQELASLQEYILVSQDRIRVEHYRFIKTQWVQTEFHGPEDVLPLVSIECEFPLGIFTDA